MWFSFFYTLLVVNETTVQNFQKASCTVDVGMCYGYVCFLRRFFRSFWIKHWQASNFIFYLVFINQLFVQCKRVLSWPFNRKKTFENPFITLVFSLNFAKNTVSCPQWFFFFYFQVFQCIVYRVFTSQHFSPTLACTSSDSSFWASSDVGITKFKRSSVYFTLIRNNGRNVLPALGVWLCHRHTVEPSWRLRLSFSIVMPYWKHALRLNHVFRFPMNLSCSSPPSLNAISRTRRSSKFFSCNCQTRPNTDSSFLSDFYTELWLLYQLELKC